MADYKAMYYHLAGRMAVAVDTMEVAVEALEATTRALSDLTKKLQLAQLTTENMFMSSNDEDDLDDNLQ